MKRLHTYVISTYLMVTIIPVLIFGSLLIAREIYLNHQTELASYEQVITQQQLNSEKALGNFDLQEAELVAMEIAHLDNIVSVKLESSVYGMIMAEIINSDTDRKQLDLLNYPIYDSNQQEIGQLTVVKDRSAFINSMFISTLPKAIIFLVILSSLGFLFSWAILSALKPAFTELQKFAFQITNGDYVTPSKTSSKFTEVTLVFKAMEAMRTKLGLTISDLRASEERYSKTYNLTQVCLFVIDVKQIQLVRSNSKFREVFHQIPDEKYHNVVKEFMHQLLACDHNQSFNYSLPVHSGLRHFQVNRSKVSHNEVECSALDISELVKARHKAEMQLITDALTRVPNRFSFNDFVAKADSGKLNEATLMMIDLNGFKTINDTYGHAAGDQLLIEVAKRLSEQLTLSFQSLYRLGGDEFVITIEKTYVESDIRAFVQRILTIEKEPINYLEHSFTPSLSIGIEHYSQRDGTSIQRRLNNADLVMYRAKSMGTGVAFSPDLLRSTVVEQVN